MTASWCLGSTIPAPGSRCPSEIAAVMSAASSRHSRGALTSLAAPTCYRSSFSVVRRWSAPAPSVRSGRPQPPARPAGGARARRWTPHDPRQAPRLLWPSWIPTRRRSLSDTLYLLQAAFGDDLITASGDDLSTRRASQRCGGCRSASWTNRPEAAVRLYAGPFLDGPRRAWNSGVGRPGADAPRRLTRRRWKPGRSAAG
jgi:hypothetical protein